jgi:hypothetical protein
MGREIRNEDELNFEMLRLGYMVLRRVSRVEAFLWDLGINTLA